jgi:hypothetical protein
MEAAEAGKLPPLRGLSLFPRSGGNFPASAASISKPPPGERDMLAREAWITFSPGGGLLMEAAEAGKLPPLRGLSLFVVLSVLTSLYVLCVSSEEVALDS